MNFRKKLYSIILVICMLSGVIYVGKSGMKIPDKEAETEEAKDHFLRIGKDTLTLWYTDDAMTDYLNAAAVAYNEKYGIRILPELKSGNQYLESINQASLDENTVTPDLYLITNDALEKAYLSGLASEVSGESSVVNGEEFPASALNAVTYDGKLVAYPMYYETSVLLYNKTYMDEYAKNQILSATASDGNEESGDADAEDTNAEDTNAEDTSAEDTEVSQADIDAKVIELLPRTIEALELFADEYDAPQDVEGIFKWDVSDILYNFNFAGNYMIVGGESGDDSANIDVYNQETVQCLKIFQELNQFFSIDSNDISYEGVIQEFMEGKIVFTVAGTDAIATLENAKQEGTFAYDYDVRTMPDLNDTLKSRSRSITTAVAINGYSGQKQLAADFAGFLVTEYTDTLYSRSGKLAAYNGTTYDYPALETYRAEYWDSVPMPKMLETGNFWVQLEIAFTKIWNGADVDAELKALSDILLSQVYGGDAAETESAAQ